MSESMLIGFLVGGSLIVVLGRLAVLEWRLARLSRLDAKVDALLEAAGRSMGAQPIGAAQQ